MTRRSRETGFTLLEVCVVLFIVAVIFVVAAVPATHLIQEERLFAPVRALQDGAKGARLQAMTEHQTFVLRFTGDGWQVLPGNASAEARPRAAYHLPNGSQLLARGTDDADFRGTDGLLWYFAPNGLCDPLAFALQQGRSWVRFRVDPLTARVEDQQSFVE